MIAANAPRPSSARACDGMGCGGAGASEGGSGAAGPPTAGRGVVRESAAPPEAAAGTSAIPSQPADNVERVQMSRNLRGPAGRSHQHCHHFSLPPAVCASMRKRWMSFEHRGHWMKEDPPFEVALGFDGAVAPVFAFFFDGACAASCFPDPLRFVAAPFIRASSAPLELIVQYSLRCASFAQPKYILALSFQR